MKFNLYAKNNNKVFVLFDICLPNIILNKKITHTLGPKYKVYSLSMETVFEVQTCNEFFRFKTKILGFGFEGIIREKI